MAYQKEVFMSIAEMPAGVERRLAIDRRQFSFLLHFPERRSGIDRRYRTIDENDKLNTARFLAPAHHKEISLDN